MPNKISLSDRERKLLLQYASQRVAALKAAAETETILRQICQIVIERAGGKPEDKYSLSEDCRELCLVNTPIKDVPNENN